MTELFIILLICGILLVAIEMFVPGGVLGVLGTMALIIAIVVAFVAFGPQLGFIAAVGVVLLLGIALIIWINVLPKTAIGKALTLSKSGADFKATDEHDQTLQHAVGIAITQLHPAGIAEINGERIDVVADGTWIAKDQPIRVLSIEGNHVTVGATSPETTEQ